MVVLSELHIRTSVSALSPPAAISPEVALMSSDLCPLRGQGSRSEISPFEGNECKTVPMPPANAPVLAVQRASC